MSDGEYVSTCWIFKFNFLGNEASNEQISFSFSIYSASWKYSYTCRRKLPRVHSISLRTCYAMKHFEISLALLWDAIAIIILAKFESDLKIYARVYIYTRRRWKHIFFCLQSFSDRRVHVTITNNAIETYLASVIHSLWTSILVVYFRNLMKLFQSHKGWVMVRCVLISSF